MVAGIFLLEKQWIRFSLHLETVTLIFIPKLAEKNFVLSVKEKNALSLCKGSDKEFLSGGGVLGKFLGEGVPLIL